MPLFINHLTRRAFLRNTAIAGTTTAFSARSWSQVAGANADIRVAVVGLNGRGGSHLSSLRRIAGVRLVALCDVDTAVLARVKSGLGEAGAAVRTFVDIRDLLAMPDLDAISIATPNHLHALQAIWAAQAGKDVYVEKPVSHNIWEGRQLVTAATKYNRVIQCGTQIRSGAGLQEAVAFVRAGNLGKVTASRGFCYKRRDSIGKTQGPQKIPATVNHDLWTGPAPMTELRRAKLHYDWHWDYVTGNGDVGNQGIHQMDVARWMLGEAGLPSSVASFGGRFGYLDDAETPNTLVSVFTYPSAPLIFEVRGLPMKAGMKAMDAYRGSRVGVVVQCAGGYITVSESGTGATRAVTVTDLYPIHTPGHPIRMMRVRVSESGTANIFDNDNKKIQGLSNGGNGSHRANFVKAVQSRKVVQGLVEECHYSSALCHLGNVSFLLGKEQGNAAIAEAVKTDVSSSEAFSRVMEHLKANEVDTAKTKTVKGPLLKIDPKTEMFVGSEKTLIDAANNNPLRKRAGRGAFTIPQLA